MMICPWKASLRLKNVKQHHIDVEMMIDFVYEKKGVYGDS